MKSKQSHEDSPRINPDQANAWLGMGLLLEQQSDLQGARWTTRVRLGFQPDPQTFERLGRTLARFNRISEARAVFRERIKAAARSGRRSARARKNPARNRRAKILALLARHREKCSDFLIHILAAAFRALDLRFVLFEGQDDFEGLVAIVTDVLVHGHGKPPACKTW